MRIEEKTLILPALYIIKENGTASTSELIKGLTKFFNPSGEDAEILNNRSDTKFSQKVRNLKSHRENNGMVILTNYDNGKYSLTTEGEEYLLENSESIRYINENPFKYDDKQNLINVIDSIKEKKKNVYIYDESDIVSEGKTTKKETLIKKRCAKLREAVIAKYTREDGRIICEVCGFDFEEKYGEQGAGYIEIHHEKPVYQYSDDGFESYIKEAVEKMKPLCANCHRMIHRKIKEPITINELKTIIK